jgi:hypothetical protein
MTMIQIMSQPMKVRLYYHNLEIIEYADYLGIDIDEDQDLLFIAREGVTFIYLFLAKSTFATSLEGVLGRGRGDLLF